MKYLFIGFVLLCACRPERAPTPIPPTPSGSAAVVDDDDDVTPRALARVLAAHAQDGEARFVYGCEAPDGGAPKPAVGDAVDLYAPSKRLGRFRVASVEHYFCCDHWSCQAHVTMPRGAPEGTLLAVLPCRASAECDVGACIDGRCAPPATSSARPLPTQADLVREGLDVARHDPLHTFDLDGDGAPDAVSYAEDVGQEDGGTLKDYPVALFLYDPTHRAWVMQHASEP